MSADAPQIASGGRRTEKVYRALLADIKEGRYEAHSRLPTENELAETFAVSRPVVRNALALLKQQGLVRSIQGSGTVVIFGLEQPAHEQAAGAMLGGSVRDLQRCFEFRILIEGESAYAAALRHNPRTLEQMADCVYATRGATAPPSAEQTYQTFDFHRAVTDAADNVFLQQSLELIEGSAGFKAYLSRRRRKGGAYHDHSQVNSEHIEIFHLIERRQASEARDAMRGHIQRAHDSFMGRIPLTDRDDL
ncbi:FadR/GntR family transcriptional regulator [Microvirga pudoricolor]|uniref:FadR/GntR family transcriptional regulator n=1 Tax=Microvirga pudoricolor TaxID=2778729 RepID=UPI0019525A93|nr:GntR family transcriptional regulator [Microvirga pudoricolor]MBM6596373.1 FadR family transcriptional regulator [Microvirga pudoricolor]